MADQQRELPRYEVCAAVDVYDSLKDRYLGRLVNIHSRGLMLLGDQMLREDSLYQLDLHLPILLNGRRIIHLGVDCLWTRNVDHNGKHWSGFAIIDASEPAREDVLALIDHLGQISA